MLTPGVNIPSDMHERQPPLLRNDGEWLTESGNLIAVLQRLVEGDPGAGSEPYHKSQKGTPTRS